MQVAGGLGRIVTVSRKEGGTSQPETISGWDARIVRRAQQRDHGKARFLSKNLPHTYQAVAIIEPARKKYK